MATKPQAPQERKFLGSLRDPSRPLGEGILQRAEPTTAPTEETFQHRARQAARQSAADRFDVAGRAKVIGVLRKAQEFMSTSNPPPNTEAEVRRALELASGGVGAGGERGGDDPRPRLRTR